MAIVTLTKDNFQQEVMQATEPVLVDFWASWCGPCRMLSPIVDQLAEELGGKVKVGKVNVDDEQALAEQFRIQVLHIWNLLLLTLSGAGCQARLAR